MSIGHKAMMHAAKAMAVAAVEAIVNPEIVVASRAEFDRRTGGQPYLCPIPPEVDPRVV
jgi:aminobenzoyl-glutamate utilization protein B